MSFDETKAIEEIKSLSENARLFLQHEICSSLTTAMLALSERKNQTAADELWAFKAKTTKWGL